ncbi:MAG: tRNA preQ1(34) S-adenosylmethionine ribosyltransferase-isomerase QueA [Myxococcota bacterium]|nr:tRNA preQ1(34) S-adenosylmethionine ribosyltransferase-isomerase QueA [Myxococcota bacterium]
MRSSALRVDDLVSSYSFELDPERIAQLPAEVRDQSRLLVVDRQQGRIQHRRFSDLPQFLQAGDLVVANDTQVLPARLRGRKALSGGRVEIMALRPLEDGESWAALVRPSARIRPGTRVQLQPSGGEGEGHSTVLEVAEVLPDGSRRVVGVTRDLLEGLGEAPLPPYIDRSSGLEEGDRERYQTVYARVPGAVAAPTAGLHFSDEVLRTLAEQGVEFETVTLHVGPGTFQPIRTEQISDHRMHAEEFRVPEETAEALLRCEARGGRLLAVGTTSCRSLETWHRLARPGDGLERSSSLFLHPGNPPQLSMSLLTNFHLPQSTLLMLVASFLGRDRSLELYREAINEGYRFYSYGDAMLIL